jgi:hypothetical protein
MRLGMPPWRNDMTDRYQQRPNPYGQQPGGYGSNPHGGPQDPYGQGQPHPYGAQPNPRDQQPDPYAQQPPYGGGQRGPGQRRGFGDEPNANEQTTRIVPPGQPLDPYQTRRYEPGQFGPGGPGDQYGQYQGTYGQPPGWGGAGPGGGLPPNPPRNSRLPTILFSVLAVLVIAAGVVVAGLLLDDDGSTPAAQATTAPSAQPETTSPKAPTTTPPATTTSASGETFAAGQCATLTPEPGNRATLNEALCGDSNSDVVVALVQDRECVRDYITFNADVGKVYCLALDAQEGACFKFDQLAKRALNCATGTHKVAKIFERVTDSSQCDQVQGADRRYAYPEPARTVCLVPAA